MLLFFTFKSFNELLPNKKSPYISCNRNDASVKASATEYGYFVVNTSYTAWEYNNCRVDWSDDDDGWCDIDEDDGDDWCCNDDDRWFGIDDDVGDDWCCNDDDIPLWYWYW